MIEPNSSLPVVRQLPDDFSLANAFARVATRPGCLWFDSASRGPCDHHGNPIGRFSFLTADPIEKLVAFQGEDDPWPQLDAWCRRLPSESRPELPPFQGGIAGLLGYEAATWLESVGTARCDDLPTPAVSLGLYDWTVAFDHVHNCGWLLSQGLGAADPENRLHMAEKRADEIERLLNDHWSDQPVSNGSTEVELFPQHATVHPDVTSNFSSEEFKRCVAEIVRLICEGDSFQVNLAQRLLAKSHLAPSELYLKLRDRNPAPFGAFYRGDGFAVLSSSPEGFLQVRDRIVETRPIKGTVPRTGDDATDEQLAQLLSDSDKDRAENVMIADLMRNDLSRVCDDDSVIVTQLCELERYEFVQHLVSVVRGELSEGRNVADLLRACFPGGSVTGAPKIEAMRTIARLEPNPRGPYCGSMGYISCGGNADFNILIRTITEAHGYWQIPVGGGITARSEPASEEAETWVKAEGMLRAITRE